MKQYIPNLKNFITKHFQKLIVIVVAFIIAGTAAALFMYNNPPEQKPTIVTQPADACKMFTADEARSLLGETVINLNTEKPVLSGNITTSTCSYTDTNRDENAMRVAAVIVRTGINPDGDTKITDDFAASKPDQGIVDAPEFGQDAYFDPAKGQLKILDTHLSIIISYGVGLAPTTNTLEDATKLAHLLLDGDSAGKEL